MWPKSSSVAYLAFEKASLTDEGLKCPFVFTKMKHRFPVWCIDKPTDNEILHVNLWSVAFQRYAIAAAAIDVVSEYLILQFLAFSY